MLLLLFFFNDPATTEIYTLSLHDALPISTVDATRRMPASLPVIATGARSACEPPIWRAAAGRVKRQSCLKPGRTALKKRSEEHTSELQSLAYLVCRLLLEKKKSLSARTFV